ncbi:MAG: ATP-binding protein [Candidatus Omnitrophica bacterium]|jgi:putative PEP-CTERM system histidine kinase|nr:ATP-binding protein [Candidatus Omnitrophota bacterium]
MIPNQHIFLIIIIANLILLGFSAFSIFRKKHIINLLGGLSLISLLVLEVGKLFLILNINFYAKILSLGYFLTLLFWLATSTSVLPSKPFSLNRAVLTPLFGFISLIFFFIWWINPFISIGTLDEPLLLSKLAQYFFVLVVFSLTLVLFNLERALYYLKQKNIKILLVSAIFLLVPYILSSTYAVLFTQLNIKFLIYSSLSLLAGTIIFISYSKHGFVNEAAEEDSGVQASMVLFLIGGYLFFVGAFIKLFKLFGWNLNTLFSFLTTIFIFFIAAFIIFSSQLRERIKGFIFKNFSRQKYDWQKIWEEFTYKISLVTEIGKLIANIKEAISKIMNIKGLKVYVFEKDFPFENEFCDWLLRRAEAFKVEEVFGQEFSNRFPLAKMFFKENQIESVSPLYGDRKIIGLIGFKSQENFLDKELLKLLSLQASGAILNCWANQALREAEKKESIYKVSSFVIHDVKNYINNLSLLVNNKDKFSNPKFQDDALYTLENTIKKMQELTDEFRALRGDLVLKRKEHKLISLVDEAISIIAKDRLKDIDITKDINDSIEVLVDAYYIERVITNIILNALEAMDKNGKLIIKSDKKDKYVYLSIKDNGHGMTKEFIQNKLFKPFNSTKERGMGIGLYQCKTIIEAHGGEITAESKEKEGTIFTIKLPLAKERCKV